LTPLSAVRSLGRHSKTESDEDGRPLGLLFGRNVVIADVVGSIRTVLAPLGRTGALAVLRRHSQESGLAALSRLARCSSWAAESHGALAVSAPVFTPATRLL
jgi:hypothetical protein